MLSILIPCYNFDVRPLVHRLHQQVLQLSVPAEIRCVEDASAPLFVQLNKSLQTLSHVHWEALPQNLGRSKIRNYLAQTAQYEFLLFMDSDSMPTRDDYLAHYVAHLPTKGVLYGGRSYAADPPTDPQLYFHWFYGTQREVQATAQRQQRPYHAFMTNNFLIPKTVFATIQFDESLTQYGHEDTLFGCALAQAAVPILHLSNPLQHIGLEPRDQFLNKSQMALQNLKQLYQSQKLHAGATRLLVWYQRLQPFRCLILVFAYLTIPFLKRYLYQKKQASLFVFDVYKLLYLYLNRSKH